MSRTLHTDTPAPSGGFERLRGVGGSVGVPGIRKDARYTRRVRLTHHLKIPMALLAEDGTRIQPRPAKITGPCLVEKGGAA